MNTHNNLPPEYNDGNHSQQEDTKKLNSLSAEDFNLEAISEDGKQEKEISQTDIMKEVKLEFEQITRDYYTGEELLNMEIKEIPFLVESLFQKVGLACLGGSSDVGKSSFLRQLVVEVVSGKNSFLGHKINSEHKSAIYVSTEDDHTAVAYLLSKFNEGRQIDPHDLTRLRFVFEGANLVERLTKMLEEQRADLVVIDAFTDLYSGSMNESNQVRRFLTEFSQLANRYQCLFLFLHHTGKRTEKEPPSKNNLLGSQAFEAKMRLVIEMRADPTDGTQRHLCIVKGNYLPGEEKKQSYVLRFEENMSFTSTGERCDFSELVESPDGVENRRIKWEKACMLKIQGATYDQIAKQIGYSSKSSVSKLFKEFGAVSTETDGNEQETSD